MQLKVNNYNLVYGDEFIYTGNMDVDRKTVKQYSDVIRKRLLEIRPEGKIVYRPFERNSLFMNKLIKGPIFVDLRKFYPKAENGNICYVGTNLNCSSEYDLNLWIWGDVVFFYDGKADMTIIKTLIMTPAKVRV